MENKKKLPTVCLIKESCNKRNDDVLVVIKTPLKEGHVVDAVGNVVQEWTDKQNKETKEKKKK